MPGYFDRIVCPKLAEMLATRSAIQWSLNAHFSRLIIEVDAAHDINGAAVDFSAFGLIAQDCCHMLQQLHDVTVS